MNEATASHLKYRVVSTQVTWGRDLARFSTSYRVNLSVTSPILSINFRHSLPSSPPPPSPIMGRTPGKRSFEQVDLTTDEAVNNTRHHPTPRTTTGQRFGQDTSFVPLSQSGEDEDDAHATDLIQGSQDAGDDVSTYIHYGDLKAKIVGVRYYRGHATIGEHVRVVRDPGNPYDSNAIRVDNVMGQQIGHIPRTAVAKLAKYLVSNFYIRLYCVV